MTHLNPTQTAQAVTLGQLVNAAYTMYDNDPSNPRPAPVQLPGNYEFVAWVQMRDFIFNYGNWTCYGLIARNPSVANNYVLAIRGTSDWTEWWDDLTSMALTPMPGFGEVGYGFYSIYQTLRIVSLLTPPGMGAAASPAAESMESAGTFADQVAAAVQRHAAANLRPGEAAAAKKSVTVTGHSLGSALATLYVAQNSQTKKVETPLLCTLASPRVGDYDFKTIFNGLGIQSWRIVNEPDLIPNTPYFGFWHIATEYEYDSGLVDDSVAGMLAFDLHLSAPARSEPAAVVRLRLVDGEDGCRGAAVARKSATDAAGSSFAVCGRERNRYRGAGRHHDQHHDQSRLKPSPLTSPPLWPWR